MKADIHEKSVVQSASGSGFLKGTWAYDHTINCYATSIQTDAVSDSGAGKKFNAEYDEYDFIKVHTGERLNKRQRITNIKGADGKLIWVDDELGGAAMIFEVQGVTALLDPFGAVVQYEVLAKRVEVQSG
jgi:hypothetical protein